MEFYWDICGHEKEARFLQDTIERGNLSHGYLISGPPKIGKKRFIDHFVSSLFCLSQKKPCWKCEPCLSIKKGSFLDVEFLSLKEGEKNISVQTVRNLISRLNYKNFSGAYKVAVIDDAEKMNKSAANCLLKTLEEPVGKTILILSASCPEGLLPTIRSRVLEIRFKKVSQTKIMDYLQEKGVSREQGQVWAEASHGAPGRAIDFWKNKELFSEYQESRRKIEALFHTSLVERFLFVDSILEPRKAKSFLEQYIWFCRKQLMRVFMESEGSAGKPLGYGAREWVGFLTEAEKALLCLGQNVNLKLLLQNLVLKIK